MQGCFHSEVIIFLLQRGLNENTTGLLRQCWPKTTDFKIVSVIELRTDILQLNKRARKKF